MIGINSRSTRDADATIKAYPVTESKISEMLTEILKTNVGDEITFTIKSIKDIRQEDEYGGYRVVVLATFDRVRQHIKVDISTGDELTPSEVEYEFNSSFGFESIPVLSYNLETILAEKLESILSKAEATTRMRDFYDVYILVKFYEPKLNISLFAKALKATAKHRGTEEVLEVVDDILEILRDSSVLRSHWDRYQKKYSYATNLTYDDVLFNVKKLAKMAV